jgi:hypothetical protein
MRQTFSLQFLVFNYTQGVALGFNDDALSALNICKKLA